VAKFLIAEVMGFMRVTNKIIQNRVLRGLRTAAQRLSESHERVATNKNLKRPSDDPVAHAKAMTYHRDLYKLRQTVTNAKSAFDTFSYTDTILEKVDELLVDARNKAASMATDTVSEEARSAVAGEIQIMISQMLQLANTQFAGRYVFAGHKVNTQPYQDNGIQIAYYGDEGEIAQRVELGGQTITVNVPGPRVFGSGTGQAGEGIFEVLKDLRDSLNNNNTDEIRNSLSSIDDEIDKIANIRGEVGAKINRTQASMDELGIIELLLAGELSKIEEVDMALEAGKYVANQEAYQAALQATSSILKLPRLTDYL